MMNRRISALTLCTTLAFAACGDANSGTQDAAAEEIAERLAGYLAAIERGDVGAAADYWTEGARLLGPGFDLDRSAVLEAMRAVFDAGTRVDVLSRTTLELFTHGDVAYEIAQAEEIFVSGTEAPVDTMRNNIFVRWERGGDGVWRFDRAVLGPQASAAQ
jgi:ketosteroid isomerase-like protein